MHGESFVEVALWSRKARPDISGWKLFGSPQLKGVTRDLLVAVNSRTGKMMYGGSWRKRKQVCVLQTSYSSGKNLRDGIQPVSRSSGQSDGSGEGVGLVDWAVRKGMRERKRKRERKQNEETVRGGGMVAVAHAARRADGDDVRARWLCRGNRQYVGR